MLRRRRYLLAHAVLVAVFATGAGHYALHRFARHAGAFGPEPHPAEPWALKLHGAAAMATLLLLGSLLGPHAWRFWRAGRNRLAGGLLGVLTVALVASGYALYYAGDDQLRELARQGHIAVGFGVAPAFLAHWYWGRRAVRRAAGRAPGGAARPTPPSARPAGPASR